MLDIQPADRDLWTTSPQQKVAHGHHSTQNPPYFSREHLSSARNLNADKSLPGPTPKESPVAYRRCFDKPSPKLSNILHLSAEPPNTFLQNEPVSSYTDLLGFPGIRLSPTSCSNEAGTPAGHLLAVMVLEICREGVDLGRT